MRVARCANARKSSTTASATRGGVSWAACALQIAWDCMFHSKTVFHLSPPIKCMSSGALLRRSSGPLGLKRSEKLSTRCIWFDRGGRTPWRCTGRGCRLRARSRRQRAACSSLPATPPHPHPTGPPPTPSRPAGCTASHHRRCSPAARAGEDRGCFWCRSDGSLSLICKKCRVGSLPLSATSIIVVQDEAMQSTLQRGAW